MEHKVSAATKGFINTRDLLFHIYIPLEDHTIKKNNRPIMVNRASRRPFVGKSEKLKKAEMLLTTKFNQQRGKMQMLHPITDDVWLICYFHYAKDSYFTKQGVRKKTLGDLSNHYQIVEDCLQDAKIIENDSQIQAHDFSRILPHEETALEVFLVRMSAVKQEDKYWEHLRKFQDPH